MVTHQIECQKQLTSTKKSEHNGIMVVIFVTMAITKSIHSFLVEFEFLATAIIVYYFYFKQWSNEIKTHFHNNFM